MRLWLLKVVILLVVTFNLSVVSDATKLKGYPKLISKYFFNVIETSVGKTQCASDLKGLIHDLINMKKWALHMVDASGKISPGVLAGHVYMTGNFDQCLEISEQKNNTLIKGQYCSVIFTSSKNNSGPLDFLWNTASLAEFLGIRLSEQSQHLLKVIRLHYGLCIPHSCSIGNLQKIWDYIEHTFRAPFHVDFVDSMCRTEGKEVEPYFVDKYIISFFVVYIVILFICTWYDLVIHQQIEGKQDNYIVAFSLFTNAKKLFCSTSSSQDDKMKNMSAISGLKVLCMLWVIYGHRTVLNFFSGVTNTVHVHQLKSRVEASFVMGGSYAVDTFLALSGLLLSYGFFKNQDLLKKRKRFPIIPMYIYRFLRLSPALLATVLFYISIFKKLGDGPGWSTYSRKLSGSCALTWWGTILYISNYIDLQYQCVEHSWYLAVDTQLFLIAPFILMYFLKKPWKTCLLCLAACIISGVYSYVITVQNEYGAIYVEGNQAYLENIYGSTFVRMPPWFIGMIFGFLINKYRDIKIPMVTNIFLWTCTIAAALGLILVHQLFTRNDDYSAFRAGLFNSCARQAWALVVGSLVFLCSTGHGGKINEWLSLPIFQVLVKLSYSVYLIQIVVIMYFIGTKRHSDYFSRMKLTHDFMGDLIFIFAAATVWCLAFESPYVCIGKIFYQKALKETSSDQLVELTKKKKKNKKGYMVCVYKFEEKDGQMKKLD